MERSIHEVTKHEFFRNEPPNGGQSSIELISEAKHTTPRGVTLHELEVRLVNHDHSIGNMLVDALLTQRPDVTHAAYTKRHPQDHAVDLSVTSMTDPHAALGTAIETCKLQLARFQTQFQTASGCP